MSERDAERNRVEGALRKQEESLQRQADLLDLANEAIFAFELGGKIVYWNSGAEQLYGYSSDEAMGKTSHDLLATDFPNGWSAFETELTARREWNGELKQVTKSGRPIDVESRFKLIDDRAGGCLVLECNRDISQRKRAARRLATEHAVTLALAESETPETAWRKILDVLGEGLDWQVGSPLDRQQKGPSDRMPRDLGQSVGPVCRLRKATSVPGPAAWACQARCGPLTNLFGSRISTMKRAG